MSSSTARALAIAVTLLHLTRLALSTCPAACHCPLEAPKCAPGVGLVRDDCGCCKVCAKQLNEDCSKIQPCDHTKGLECNFGASSTALKGICRAQSEGRPCEYNSRIYQNGESFQPNCKHQCTCIDGAVGCIPLCPQELSLPNLGCPNPRLVKVSGQCCEEWVCDEDSSIKDPLDDQDDLFGFDASEVELTRKKMEAFWESRAGHWAGGPAPGQFYRVPSTPCALVDPASALCEGPITRTQNPMVTGTSVLGVKFDGGVVIAADMLGSYGSLARFRNISRIMRVNDSTMLGASGDYADFQYLKQVLGQMVIDEELLGDGHSYSPRAIHSWLTRAMYSRRSKMNPLWNTMVIGGYADGESFLGYVDMLGVAYEAPSLATGYGAYLAQPLLREVLEKQPVLSQTEARDLVERCMRVLYYRDARSYNRFQIATVTEKGVEIEGPLSAETNWEIAHMISGFE